MSFITIKVKVVPSSSRDCVAGWLGDALKVKVMAPPEKGRANAAVINLLAARLGISRKAIDIVSGHASPDKVIRIEGVSGEQVKSALGT